MRTANIIAVLAMAGAAATPFAARAATACEALFKYPDVAYSAIRTVSLHDTMKMNYAIHYTPHKERADPMNSAGSPIPMGGMTGVRISDLDAHEQYVLHQESKSYEVKALPKERRFGNVELTTCSYQGKATVDGMAARKYKVIGQMKSDGGAAGTMGGYIWSGPHNVMLQGKFVGEMMGHKVLTVVRLHDLKFAPQPARLFAVPSGYHKLAAGGGNSKFQKLMSLFGSNGGGASPAQDPDSMRKAAEAARTAAGQGQKAAPSGMQQLEQLKKMFGIQGGGQ